MHVWGIIHTSYPHALRVAPMQRKKDDLHIITKVPHLESIMLLSGSASRRNRSFPHSLSSYRGVGPSGQSSLEALLPALLQ